MSKYWFSIYSQCRSSWSLGFASSLVLYSSLLSLSFFAIQKICHFMMETHRETEKWSESKSYQKRRSASAITFSTSFEYEAMMCVCWFIHAKRVMTAFGRKKKYAWKYSKFVHRCTTCSICNMNILLSSKENDSKWVIRSAFFVCASQRSYLYCILCSAVTHTWNI